MPRNLGELGEMFSSEEVRELRQEDQTEIQKLRHDKKMLEEKILRLKKLSEPFMAEMFNVQASVIKRLKDFCRSYSGHGSLL